MLDSLYVKNLALIDEEEVTFTEGLNVLSGETGAGKSILIGSVLIALGAKVHKEMIRANEKEAYIELIFSPTHPAVLEKLREYDIEPEDGQLIISKKITASKSVSKINKEAYPASKVREVASLLLDVHGQHDHQALIHQHKQLEIVDRSGGKKLKEAKEQTAQYYRIWKQYKDELDSYSVSTVPAPANHIPLSKDGFHTVRTIPQSTASTPIRNTSSTTGISIKFVRYL